LAPAKKQTGRKPEKIKRIYMNQPFIKRGYNFPPELLALWEEFHKPSKDYSPSAAAAFLLYMACDATTREILRKEAFVNSKHALELAKQRLKTTSKD
jgi:hypothetical protein